MLATIQQVAAFRLALDCLLLTAFDFLLTLSALARFGDEGRTRWARARMTEQRASVRTSGLGSVHQTATGSARTTTNFSAAVWSLQTIELWIFHFAAKTEVFVRYILSDILTSGTAPAHHPAIIVSAYIRRHGQLRSRRRRPRPLASAVHVEDVEARAAGPRASLVLDPHAADEALVGSGAQRLD